MQKSATNRTNGSFRTLLFSTILVLCCSCDNSKPPATASIPSIPDKFLADWSEVTFTKSETNLVLRSHNSTFGSIVGTIRLHLGKKVVLGSGVESTKKIPDVLIEMKTGAPLELLKEVAAQGGYVAIETHDEFIVNTK